MKAAIFTSFPYMGEAPGGVWPVPVETYSSESAEKSMEQSLAQLQLADELGFDWVTVAEHHYAPMSLTPNPMVMAGALTQRVKKAKIALLGADVPILNPLRVAEEFAMLDTLTGGRVIAGMLRGTSNEYVTYNVNPAESRERFEEALQLIIKAWTEPQPFGWQGRYYEFRAISIWPRPVQKPYPPIFMSGSSPEGVEFAARHHINLGYAVTNVPLARESTRYYREQAALCGWEPTEENILYRVGIHVADSDEQAMEDLRPAAGSTPRASYSTSNRVLDEVAAAAGYYGRDIANQRGRLTGGGQTINDRIELGQVIVGKPATVLNQVQAIRDSVGAGTLDLTFLPMGRDKTFHAIELFGTQVLPRMHEL